MLSLPFGKRSEMEMLEIWLHFNRRQWMCKQSKW